MIIVINLNIFLYFFNKIDVIFRIEMACLSSTTLTKQLTNQKYEEFCGDVTSHLDNNTTDTVSALKGIL